MLYNFFTNIINVMFVAVFLVVGVLIGLLTRPSPKNQVAYIRERDARGEDLDVSTEGATTLETKSSPTLRFFKYHKGYTFKSKSRFGKAKTFTRFLAKEGTAFLWKISGFDLHPIFQNVEETVMNGEGVETTVTVKRQVGEEPKEITIECDTLEDAVKNRWGDDFYKTVPADRQAQLQHNKVLVTVGLEPGLTPDGFNPITEQLMWREAAANSAGMFAGKIKDAAKTPVLNYIPWIGLGIGAMAILALLMGWIQLRPPP